MFILDNLSSVEYGIFSASYFHTLFECLFHSYPHFPLNVQTVATLLHDDLDYYSILSSSY